MGSRSKVEMIVSEKDQQELLALLSQSNTTIDKAHEWLSERGYDMSRNAVWNFMRKRRASLPAMHFGSVAICRCRLTSWIKKLDARDLRIVASLACILVDGRGTKGGTVRKPK